MAKSTYKGDRSVSKKSTPNTGQTSSQRSQARGGQSVAAYKAEKTNLRSDAVAAPPKYGDIRGVKNAGSPKAQPMYTGKPSRSGKTAEQVGSGLVKEVTKGRSDGYTNEFPDSAPRRGSGRPVSGSQKGQ